MGIFKRRFPVTTFPSIPITSRRRIGLFFLRQGPLSATPLQNFASPWLPWKGRLLRNTTFSCEKGIFLFWKIMIHEFTPSISVPSFISWTATTSRLRWEAKKLEGCLRNPSGTAL